MSEDQNTEEVVEVAEPEENELAGDEALQSQLTWNAQDFATMAEIIKVCSKRGVFEPNEMLVVGTLYTKLEAIIAQWNAAQAAQAEEEADAAGDDAGGE
tara:strand:- start:505 stop:801 length:297 start_codon:yes stop_codon:yes gene_type:complete